MQQTEVFLALVITAIVFMLLCQTLSVRICVSSESSISIEYFPLKILLYNFGKRKKKKRKLIKQTKKLLSFFTPILKSANFFLERTRVKIISLSLPEPRSDQPHRYFLSNEITSLSTIYIYSLIYAVSKSAYIASAGIISENEDITNLDVELTTRFYNVLLSGIVLLFWSIRKKGIKKIVR